MNPPSSELPFHVRNWLIISLKDFCIVIRKWPTFLPAYFQTFTPNYNDGIDHNHDLRYNALRLPMTRKEYYVQCTKYQFLKLIRETSQLDLDRCLTSSITQFIGYFKYRIIDVGTTITFSTCKNYIYL